MTVTATTSTLLRPRLDVGLAFKNGWNAFTADIVPFLVGALIAGLLSIVTLGILAGPLTAGLYAMAVRRMRDGRRAEIGDVFSCFDRFWSYLWAAIVLVVLIGLASLTIVGGVLLATIWIYVIPFMVDRRMGLTDAMTASYHRVLDNGFWEHLALLLIFLAVSAVANGWVGIITFPLTITVIVGAYFASHDYDRQFVRLAGPAAPVGPPPAPPAAPQATAPAATMATAEANERAVTPDEPVSTPEGPAADAATQVAEAAATTATVEAAETAKPVPEAEPETADETDKPSEPRA